MPRREVIQTEFPRFEVVDESVSTWAIRDNTTMLIVETGLGKFQADQMAQELNANPDEA